MTILVPNTGEVAALTLFLSANVTLKLYSNDKTPAETDVASDYTEVAGGGYTAKILSSGAWSIVAGAPSVASYTYQDFSFSGPTNAPATMYGYFVVNGEGVLLWAERFTGGVLPITPVLGTLIRITPKISVS